MRALRRAEFCRLDQHRRGDFYCSSITALSIRAAPVSQPSWCGYQIICVRNWLLCIVSLLIPSLVSSSAARSIVVRLWWVAARPCWSKRSTHSGDAEHVKPGIIRDSCIYVLRGHPLVNTVITVQLVAKLLRAQLKWRVQRRMILGASHRWDVVFNFISIVVFCSSVICCYNLFFFFCNILFTPSLQLSFVSREGD